MGLRSQPRSRDAGDRLIDAALTRLRREGIDLAVDKISIESAIIASGVPRATAYRRWPNKADFQREVLLRVVGQVHLEPDSEDTLAAITAVVSANFAGLDTERGRRTIVVTGLHIAAENDFRRVSQSRQWRDYLALRATCSTLPAGAVRESVSGALESAESSFTRHRAVVYGRLADIIGYRLVPWLDPETGFMTLAAAAGSLMTGLVLQRRQVAIDSTDMPGAFGCDDVMAWTPEAHAIVATILSYLEPDPAISWDARRVQDALTKVEDLYTTSLGWPSGSSVARHSRDESARLGSIGEEDR